MHSSENTITKYIFQKCSSSGNARSTTYPIAKEDTSPRAKKYCVHVNNLIIKRKALTSATYMVAVLYTDKIAAINNNINDIAINIFNNMEILRPEELIFTTIDELSLERSFE